MLHNVRKNRRGPARRTEASLKTTPPVPSSKLWLGAALVFAISLTILVFVTLKSGATQKFPVASDPDQYLATGRSLAAGNGFKDTVGFWPKLPDYSRMPGWPAIIAVGLRLFPGSNPEAVARFANAVCLSLAGTFFFILCQLIGVGSKLSVFAGLAVSLSPALVPLSAQGFSEISFVMIVAVGLTALLTRGPWFYLGAFILGTSALVRTNFVLVPVVLFGFVVALKIAGVSLPKDFSVTRAFLAFALALIPISVWVVRNDLLTGRFPLLSAIEGETFYGSNNDLVARDLEYWGYWVMPDQIPGETPKRELARQLGTDLALNDYYHAKGKAWVKANLSALPRLELGKFIRAFVPIPWKPLTASYIAFAYRFLLWVAWLVALPFWIRRINRTYLLFCVAMAVVHVITTAVYYGVFRFTHCYMEIFFIPAIAYGIQGWWNRGHSPVADPVVPSYVTAGS